MIRPVNHKLEITQGYHNYKQFNLKINFKADRSHFAGWGEDYIFEPLTNRIIWVNLTRQN